MSRSLVLTESEVRYAVANTKNNTEAAAFLNINIVTWRKYAKIYFDQVTGKSFYELHKNSHADTKEKNKTRAFYRGQQTMDDILAGNVPKFPFKRLKSRLIREGYKDECCEMCGFQERRISDYTVPLILVWLDGDKTNHKFENLQFICYNCYYLTQGQDFIEKDVVSSVGKLKYEDY